MDGKKICLLGFRCVLFPTYSAIHRSIKMLNLWGEKTLIWIWLIAISVLCICAPLSPFRSELYHLQIKQKWTKIQPNQTKPNPIEIANQLTFNWNYTEMCAHGRAIKWDMSVQKQVISNDTPTILWGWIVRLCVYVCVCASCCVYNKCLGPCAYAFMSM